MTRSRSRFPIASRLVAVAASVVLVTTLAAGAGAVSRSDVESANAKVQKLLGDIQDAKTQLVALQGEVAAKTAIVSQAAGKLEQLTSQLVLTQHALDRAQATYVRTEARLNERAAEAFMGGGGQSLEFLVGSGSLGELSDRIEYMNAIAQSDLDLATTVANTENQLATETAKLTRLRSQQQVLVAQAQAARAAVLDNFQQQSAQVARIQSDLAQAERYKKKVAKQYQQALKAARASSATYGGGHAPVPIPPGYEHVLERCPVDGPRSYSDGFGAPRYAGGYHLHKGVDILSNYGTPIVAPFDGYARSDYNSLGGNVVFVTGKYGTVYNAHLQSYSSNSNGAVHAGDIIGYVGDTGDAVGTPHDHFEFHPAVMPTSWPASAYGYSIIEDAVNPYPLLVKACG
jgi:murein DD-endopeptidase MepM/ murein hydrolase activator NlpD